MSITIQAHSNKEFLCGSNWWIHEKQMDKRLTHKNKLLRAYGYFKDTLSKHDFNRIDYITLNIGNLVLYTYYFKQQRFNH